MNGKELYNGKYIFFILLTL